MLNYIGKNMKFITTKQDFDKQNSESWIQNADFWSKQSGRNEENSFAAQVFFKSLRKVLKNYKKPTIIDAGCGHGWIYDDLSKNKKTDFDYIGLDYTHEFIQKNSERTKNNSNATFIQYDLTSNKKPKGLSAQGDIIINYYNLIEVWDMKSVFRNMHNMMKDDGTIIIVTTCPLSSIASLSKDNADYNKNLGQYMTRKGTIGWGEEIILNGKNHSGRTFYTAAHSVAEYVTEASKYGMYLCSMEEFPVQEVTVPQISMIMQFKKIKAK